MYLQNSTRNCFEMPQVKYICNLFYRFSLKIAASDDKYKEKLSYLQKIAFEEVVLGSFTNNISWLEKSHILLLSNQLRRLVILRSVNFLSNWLKLLPDSIKDLTLCGCTLTDSGNTHQVTNFGDIDLLPKNLISLELSCHSTLTDEGVKKIPASITRLDVSLCKKVKGVCI